MIKPGLIQTCDTLLTRAGHLSTNYLQSRTYIYNKYRHGPTKISNPQPTQKDYIKWLRESLGKDGLMMYKDAIDRFYRNRIKKFLPTYYPPNTVRIFEHFNNDDFLKRWKVCSDSDSYHGFSYAELVRSKDGHALFSGVLDNRIPDDGLTDNSGFVCMIGPSAPRTGLIELSPSWYWGNFKALEIRFRGDGRCYNMVINTSTYGNDLSFYDNFTYPLYTRGGPYWQTLRIPFEKFIFNVKNLPQDEQRALPLNKINFVAINLQDKIDGPFALEIDHIGLRNDSLAIAKDTPYETYSFAHIKYKQLSLGCDPPEN